MDKVVRTGMKIDFHIHSVYSKDKDHEKVADNTLENLEVLVRNLVKNGVNMCAITDHDAFNYSIYRKLKEQEEIENCIKKVLPGIEFSVEFEDKKVVHVIVLFNDKDDAKVAAIEQIMSEGAGKSLYKKDRKAYSPDDFYKVLSEINIDFVMIAHQKNSPTSSGKPGKNDVLILGPEEFDRIIFMEYFDAFEFRNRKNEIFNKIFKYSNHFSDKIKFITGSDCHAWKNYPYTEENEKNEFKFTYIKSLPTFRGLAMAFTDYHRLAMENSFFNPNEVFEESIECRISDEKITVPLSKGINVIIGDNSIGKSLLLNVITENYKNEKHSVTNGYSKYLEKNEITIDTKIKREDIFQFNSQGEIRKLFEEDGLKANKQLEKFYPQPINAGKYRKIVEKELDKLYQLLQKKFKYDESVRKLPKFKIPKQDAIDKAVTFLENVVPIKS